MFTSGLSSGGSRAFLILSRRKEEITERRKADKASKTKPLRPPPVLPQGLVPPLLSYNKPIDYLHEGSEKKIRREASLFTLMSTSRICNRAVLGWTLPISCLESSFGRLQDIYLIEPSNKVFTLKQPRVERLGFHEDILVKYVPG